MIPNEDEVNDHEEGQPEYDEPMDVEDETKEQQQESQTIDDKQGDPDWTLEEAESAYEQAGDDNCDQKPNPKYDYFVQSL